MEQYINDPNILNIYQFGSYLYGTNNEYSDKDYIIVAHEFFDSRDINIHVYTIDGFQKSLNNCEIQMLECINAPAEFVLKKTIDFTVNIELSLLRKSISTISSNSFVKAKKKLIVSGDYDLRAGIKSIYHSLRILSYGIQLAEKGRIYNFKDHNYVYFDIVKMSESYQRLELWEMIDKKYRKVYQQLGTDFRKFAPKSLSDYNNKIKLTELLAKHEIHNDDLVMEIMEMFKLYN